MSGNDIPGLKEARAAEAELDGLDRSFSTHVTRALILWFIRWAIGFGIIWAITSTTGRYGFLWTLGAIAATVSLALTLGAQWFMARNIARTRDKMGQLETLLRQDAQTDEEEKDQTHGQL